MLSIGDTDVFPDEDVIRRNGVTVSITPKSMDVLVYLAEHAGQTVSAEQLLQAVWPTDYIADNAVHKAVSEIRSALDDDAQNPEYLQTIRQRGYRLVAPVDFGDGAAAPTARRHGTFAAVAVAAALAMGAIVWSLWPGSTPGPDAAAVAVLPFTDMSPAGDQAHLSDGLAEELIVTLAQIDELNVVARTSAFSFRDTQTDVREIGRILGVGSVVEGSVRTADGRLRVTAQLIRTRDGVELWSNRFDRAMDDVFAIQDEIARAVAGALQVELGLVAAASNADVDFQGFELKKLGDYFLYKGDPQSLERALGYYEQALALAPGYGDAQSGIASVHMSFWGFGYDPTDARRRQYVEATARALAIDPDNPSALAAEASMAMFDFQWDSAKQSLDRALSIAPNDVPTMLTGVFLASALDDLDTATRLAERAAVLDPLNANTQVFLGTQYAVDQRWLEAAERMERAVDLAGSNIAHKYDLAYVYHRLGRDTDALGMLLSATPLSFEPGPRTGPQAGKYLLALRESMALATDDGAHCAGAALNMATAYAILEDRDHMYQCLNEAVDERRAFGIKRTPAMRAYLEEPRFKAVLERMNLSVETPPQID